MVDGDLHSTGRDELRSLAFLRVLVEELNSETDSFVPNARRREGEVLEVDLFLGYRVEEMIQVILELKTLIHVCSIVEESRRSDCVMEFILLEHLHVQLLHEKLIAEGDNRSRGVVATTNEIV